MEGIKYWILILGMTLVTYIPRSLPSVLPERIKYAPKIQKFLKLIPYTAMTALIFPGVLTVDPERIWIGIAGALVAAVLGWRKCPVMVCVLSAIGVDFLLYLIF